MNEFSPEQIKEMIDAHNEFNVNMMDKAGVGDDPNGCLVVSALIVSLLALLFGVMSLVI